MPLSATLLITLLLAVTDPLDLMVASLFVEKAAEDVADAGDQRVDAVVCCVEFEARVPREKVEKVEVWPDLWC